jgi:hypothetical protein
MKLAKYFYPETEYIIMSKTPVVDALVEQLAELSLRTDGSRDILEKRLKKAKMKLKHEDIANTKIALKEQKIILDMDKKQPYDLYAVCDFEATCIDNSGNLICKSRL